MPEQTTEIPGFNKLSVEEQIVINAVKTDPEQAYVFMMTKMCQVNKKQDDMQEKCTGKHQAVDHRFTALEGYKKYLMGAIAVLSAAALWLASK